MINNLKSSLHLDQLSIQWINEKTDRLCHSQQSVHQILHLSFKRLTEFTEIKIYLLFSDLFNKKCQKWVIIKNEYELWIDWIFLSAVNAVCLFTVVHHLLSSIMHIKFNSTVIHVKSWKDDQHDHTWKQKFHFFLESDILSKLWKHIESAIVCEKLRQFQNMQLLLTSKNLKLMTQHDIWLNMHNCFFTQWNRAVNRRYLILEFYDVEKKIVSS